MQTTDEGKLAEFHSFFKDFDLQAALSKQPTREWSEAFIPPDPRPNDNINSDEEPVLEALMKPVYDLLIEEKGRGNASNGYRLLS